MKKKDFVLVAAIAAFGAIVSLVISSFLFSSSSSGKQQAEVVQPIVANFEELDSSYFNTKSIDPTTAFSDSQVGNSNPFKN